MKKKEIIFVIVALLIAGLSYFGYRYFMETPTQYGQVIYQDSVLLEFDINDDFTYNFNGSYGHMELEVKDGAWRITNEECPNHICSSIGWVDMDSIFPIICVPNEIYVIIKE